MSVTDKSEDELESTIDRATRSIESNRGEQRMAHAQRKASVEELVERKRGEVEELRSANEDGEVDALHATRHNKITDLKGEIEELVARIDGDHDELTHSPVTGWSR